MQRPNEFTLPTMRLALARQKNHCASCGTIIHGLGESGRADHRFGEAVHAHHALHIKSGGDNSVSNCVIICQSCHYNAHEGGNYRTGTVQGQPKDFPHFNG
jgi:5-methylcytosine-specific restriction endonuclease McrA